MGGCDIFKKESWMPLLCKESLLYSETLGLPYQMLCAKKLELKHPITGEKLVLESKMDAGI